MAGSKGMCISNFKRHCQVAVQKKDCSNSRFSWRCMRVFFPHTPPAVENISITERGKIVWDRQVFCLSAGSLSCWKEWKELVVLGKDCDMLILNSEYYVLKVECLPAAPPSPTLIPRQLQFRSCPFFPGWGDNFIAADVPIWEICGAI